MYLFIFYQNLIIGEKNYFDPEIESNFILRHTNGFQRDDVSSKLV